MKKAEYKKSQKGKMWDIKWLLVESSWKAIITNRKQKKYLKDTLTRNYRRKQKQEKIDADEE